MRILLIDPEHDIFNHIFIALVREKNDFEDLDMLILWRPSQLSYYIRIYSTALWSLGISSRQEENPAGFIAAAAELQRLPKFQSTDGLHK